MSHFTQAVLLTCAVLLYFVNGQNSSTFTNPILDDNADDPFILHLDSYYYLVTTESPASIVIRKSETLTDFRNATKKLVSTGGRRPYSVEIHDVFGSLHMYFQMDIGGVSPSNYRIFSMRAVNSSDPMGEWEEPVRFNSNWVNRALQGTVLKHEDKTYMIWMSDYEGLFHKLYMGEMVNATEIKEPVVMIKRPTEEWECEINGLFCQSTSPYVIQRNGVTYLIFIPYTCFGLMTLPVGGNPMNETDWVQEGRCVFGESEEEDVFLPQSPSFTDSPDGTETWLVYSAKRSVDLMRWTARIEKISWNLDGSLNFPQPHGFNHSQPVPSGQT